MWTLDVLADYVGFLALLTILAAGYGSLRRSFLGPNGTQIVTGILFGIIAILQMHRPLEMMPGVLVDLRNIPIALAGAFLGVRGLLVTLGLSIAFRISTGGVGMEAGIAGMLFAALVGHFWSRCTAHLPSRNWLHHFALAALVSSSIWSAVLLPGDIARQFYTELAWVVALLYFAFVPMTAAQLEREVRLFELEQTQKRDPQRDTPNGLLSSAAFRKYLLHLNMASAPGTVAAVAQISLRRQNLLTLFWGTEVLDPVHAAMQLRLRKMLSHADIVGVSGHKSLLIALNSDEAANWDELNREIHAAICESPLRLPQGDELHVEVSLTLRDVAEMDLHRVLHTAKMARRNFDWAHPFSRRRRSASTQKEATLLNSAQMSLFDKADVMLKTRSAQFRTANS